MNKIKSQQTHYELNGISIKLLRVWRSIKMWGFHRTLAKTLNRLSIPIPPVMNIIPRTRDILMVGCGQFGLTSASFFISKKLGNRFLKMSKIHQMKQLPKFCVLPK